jgi:glycosyltransferase involved in cell wall biosynthesis
MLRRLPDSPFFNSFVSALVAFKFKIVDRVYLYYGRFAEIISTNRKPPLVSVLIPTYNRRSILHERALPSVLAQTYENFEIVIVDDGSHDGTLESLLALKNSRIRVIRNSRSSYRYPNKAIYHWFAGPVSALNCGLKHCKGDYIARIDDDDIWTETHLEQLLDFLQKTRSEFVYSHILARMSQGSKDEVISNSPDPLGNTCTWLYKSYLKKFKINIHCWRKSVNRVNDVDVHDRMFKAGVRINYLHEVTAVYLPRPGEKFAGSKAYISNSEKIEESY